MPFDSSGNCRLNLPCLPDRRERRGAQAGQFCYRLRLFGRANHAGRDLAVYGPLPPRCGNRGTAPDALATRPSGRFRCGMGRKADRRNPEQAGIPHGYDPASANCAVEDTQSANFLPGDLTSQIDGTVKLCI